VTLLLRSRKVRKFEDIAEIQAEIQGGLGSYRNWDFPTCLQLCERSRSGCINAEGDYSEGDNTDLSIW
jgi:hypothetical protein